MTAIYHITHVANLPAIIAAGGLWCDRHVAERQGAPVVIGFNHIKRRRLEEISVTCHPGTNVGDYVPFYFCPRSVMLYVIDRRSAELQYREGQRHIVHLVSSVQVAVASASNRPWAYSDGNAGAYYTCFYNNLNQMDNVLDWEAIRAAHWSDPAVKEKKQAEFLVHDHYPWECIHEIGVHNERVATRIVGILAAASHHPRVSVRPDWYY